MKTPFSPAHPPGTGRRRRRAAVAALCGSLALVGAMPAAGAHQAAAGEGLPGLQQVRAALGSWRDPALVLFSTEDVIFTVEVGRRFVETIPGAEPLQTIPGAGHFLQEDRGEAVGARLAAFLRRTD